EKQDVERMGHRYLPRQANYLRSSERRFAPARRFERIALVSAEAWVSGNRWFAPSTTVRPLPGMIACNASTRERIGARAVAATHQQRAHGQRGKAGSARIGRKRGLPVEHDLVGRPQHARAGVRRQSQPSIIAHPKIDKASHRQFAIASRERCYEFIADAAKFK